MLFAQREGMALDLQFAFGQPQPAQDDEGVGLAFGEGLEFLENLELVQEVANGAVVGQESFAIQAVQGVGQDGRLGILFTEVAAGTITGEGAEGGVDLMLFAEPGGDLVEAEVGVEPIVELLQDVGRELGEDRIPAARRLPSG